jgi:hypothetical protein
LRLLCFRSAPHLGLTVSRKIVAVNAKQALNSFDFS